MSCPTAGRLVPTGEARYLRSREHGLGFVTTNSAIAFSKSKRDNFADIAAPAKWPDRRLVAVKAGDHAAVQIAIKFNPQVFSLDQHTMEADRRAPILGC